MSTDLYTICIAGGSASGKTSMAAETCRWLEENSGLSGLIISCDDFYISVEQNLLEKRSDIDFDDPNRIDFNEMMIAVKTLKSIGSIDIPLYDFMTCQRIGKKTVSTYGISVMS